MRAWTAIVVGAVLAAGCRGEPRGMGEAEVMLQQDSRILHGGQEVDVSHLTPGVEVRASWEAEQGALKLERLEVMPGAR